MLDKLGDCLVSRRLRKKGIAARGNPYDVVKTKGGYGVKNTEKGTFKSRGTSKKKAMKQFNLLEGIERGWRPTRGRR
jgi:hypothetical protein